MNRMNTVELMRELEAGLAQLYGPRFRRLYFYGSYARRQESPGSDLDALVVLDRIDRYGAELERSSELGATLSLRWGVTVSLVFISQQDWESQDSAFLATVRGEALAA